MGEAVDRLIAAGTALVDAVSFDDNGAMIAGKWMGGNGGLLSRDTLAKADALRREIDAVRRRSQEDGK